jgi:hypothetical protein
VTAADRPGRLVTIYLCLACFNGRHEACTGGGAVRDWWPQQGVSAECTCAGNAHPWSVRPTDEHPTPCPHQRCEGVLVRLPDGVVECTEGHTGSPSGGHVSYD